jgi:GT2 family glycosyltransferase
MKNFVTTIIVSFKSHNIIENSIKSIGTKIPIIVIENSKDKNLKKKLEKKYNNVKVLLNNNNGFGQAANLGVKKAKTKYVLFCSPDTVLKPGALKTFVNVAKKKVNNFGLLIPSENKRSKKIFLIKEPKGAPIVFVEKKKFLKMKGYDENFFLYYEDIDFLQRFLEKNEKIFQIPAYFSHKFGSHNKIYNRQIEVNRNWHYMWSKFYYIKKKDNPLRAFLITLPSCLRALSKLSFYFLFNDNKFLIYKARFLGLVNSYLNNKSWYRPDIK